jgi:hypothetical protein
MYSLSSVYSNYYLKLMKMPKDRFAREESMRGSNMHTKLNNAMSNYCTSRNIPIFFDKEFKVQDDPPLSTFPDQYYPTKHLALFFDGDAVHHGKQKERDIELRKLLAKKYAGLRVVSLSYRGNTKREYVILFMEVLKCLK